MVIEIPAPPHDPALLRLPFDQYGRYNMIREALEAARPLLGQRLRVLDVGGYHRMVRGDEVLAARLFLPDDDVIVLDQVDCTLPGYLRGDGRGLAFADRSFDFVVSCDTLEHVPAPDRAAFWQELLRVARYGVVLAAPFASPEVVAAEDVLFAYIKAELGVEQMQLREHRQYGLPTLDRTAALLEELGLRYRVFPSGYVHAWLAMMLTKHYLLARTPDVDLHESLDAYYTRFFGPAERREPAYRHVWLVERDRANGWWQAAATALAVTIAPADAAGRPSWPDLAGWLLQLAELRQADRQLAPLAAALQSQTQQVSLLAAQLAQRDAQIADLAARAAWLEQQSSDARRALAAVEGGRLMRLMRLLRRGFARG